MFKLQRNYTPVCPKESNEQSHLGKVERTSRSYPRDQQAGFRPGKLRTIPIRSQHRELQWNNQLNGTPPPLLYVNFVEYEKALDSLDRESLWKLLGHYGVPMKFVNLIRNSYEGLSCRMVHEGRSTEKFEVKTGVRQGCLLSPFLFILAIDWIMRAVTNRKRNGIQWTLWTQSVGRPGLCGRSSASVT